MAAPEIRGRAFGHIRALDHAGAALGPVAASAFLLAFPGRERSLFLLTLLPGLVTLAVIWRTVHDPRSRTPAGRSLPRGALTRRQAVLLASVAVWSLGASSEQFLLLRAVDLGVPVALVPLVWLGVNLAKSGAFGWYALVQGLLSLPAGLLAGWLWGRGPHGPSLAFAATTMASLVACGLLAGVGPVTGSQSEG